MDFSFSRYGSCNPQIPKFEELFHLTLKFIVVITEAARSIKRFIPLSWHSRTNYSKRKAGKKKWNRRNKIGLNGKLLQHARALQPTTTRCLACKASSPPLMSIKGCWKLFQDHWRGQKRSRMLLLAYCYT